LWNLEAYFHKLFLFYVYYFVLGISTLSLVTLDFKSHVVLPPDKSKNWLLKFVFLTVVLLPPFMIILVITTIICAPSTHLSTWTWAMAHPDILCLGGPGGILVVGGMLPARCEGVVKHFPIVTINSTYAVHWAHVFDFTLQCNHYFDLLLTAFLSVHIFPSQLFCSVSCVCQVSFANKVWSI